MGPRSTPGRPSAGRLSAGRPARRLAAVGALLALALVAGATPAAAAPGDRSGCGGPAPARRDAAADRVLAALGLAVLLDGDVRADLDARAGERSGPPCPPPPAPPRPAGYATSAAALRNWGPPVRADEFDGGRLGRGWRVDAGPGSGAWRTSGPGYGVRDGVLTLTDGPRGDGIGVDWVGADRAGADRAGADRYGRWEARVRVSAGDPAHVAALMLLPDDDRVPPGVGVDVVRLSDPSRGWAEAAVRDGRRTRPPSGGVAVDATQWHNWAVEVTPTQVAVFLDGRPWWRTDRALPPGPVHLAVALDRAPRPARGPVRTTTLQVDRVAEYPLGRTGR